MSKRIIPFKPEHVECIDMRELEKQRIDADMICALSEYEAWTIIYDGRVLLCFGIVVAHDGIGQIWQIPSIYVPEYQHKYARECLQWVNDIAKDYKLHRLESDTVDDELHRRWMSFLGFELEGVKRMYVDQKDYLMWGKVWAQK